MTDEADVVVTDGFTGNVALKTLEGGLKSLVGSLLAAFDSSDEAREASATLWPVLGPLYATLDPENTGGAMLLGVDGVCIISHGSSSGTAVVNAVRVARDMVEGDVVAHLRTAVRGS
jgi:glycerol-3-phosphate acyltransferase PlsX